MFCQSQLDLPMTVMRSLGSMLSNAMLILLASASSVVAQAATLEGTALYRERITLPPDVVFQAVLQEAPRAGATPKVLGQATINPAGQPPFRFQIEYDEAAIRPGGHYVVTATIKREGQLLFTTRNGSVVLTRAKAPLTVWLASARMQKQPELFSRLPASYEREVPGANSLVRWHLDVLSAGTYQLRTTYLDKSVPNQVDQIGRWQYDRKLDGLRLHHSDRPTLYFAVASNGDILRQIDAEGKPLEAHHDEPLRRLPELALIEPRLALSGMFTYMADAASIVLCDDGRRLPVAMGGDYKALEKAYVEARPQTGKALYVRLDGLIAKRPSQEESQPPRPTLGVEHFIDIQPGESCGSVATHIPLQNTYWKLVQLNGKAVTAVDRKQEAHLIFSSEGNRVSCSGGCNRVTGSFELDGDKLHLRQMVGTMMACITGMDQERQFLQTLTKVESYRTRGGHLDMLDAEGAVIARFEAVALQ